MKVLIALLRKEAVEDLLAARGALLFFVSSMVLSAYMILLMSNTELSLMDSAQAVYLMSGIILTLVSLLAIIRGSDSFAGERERGTLETLILTPATGRQLASGKLASILLAWFILLIICTPYLWAVGWPTGYFWPAFGYLSLTGTLLALTFGGLALALSARAKSVRSVLLVGLTLLLLSGSPVLLSPSLRRSSVGRVADLLNPFADALNALDSAVIDREGITFQIVRLTLMICYAIVAMWILYGSTKRIEQ